MPSLHDLRALDLDATPGDEVVIRRSRPTTASGEVAIIGMSGRVGASEDLDDFWRRVVAGEQGFADLSEVRRADTDAYLAARGASLPIDPARYVGGTRLPDLAAFDHRFFGMSAVEARLVDPNQRIFLQTAWAALEDAGRLGEDLRGSTVGVYVGMSADFGPDYRTIIEAIAPDAPEVSVAGNIKSIMASRLAYLLDLRGPSMLIDTACSSGLVATLAAVRAIRSGECSMAVVGGVKSDLVPVIAGEDGLGIRDLMETSSADGRTRTFDRRSDGTSSAEGAIAFVLTSLEDAQRNGDHIRAVISGGAMNQDGASNGITAPNADAQGRLITAALADAGVRAEDVSYIEAHGTATRLGDPVEVGGIQRAFSRETERKQFCAVGTVKSLIGHMDNVSGLAGLANVVSALGHRTLPASRNFEEPNPNIAFPQSPLYVNDRVRPWGDDPAATLYGGVSSFGLSGTNCHLVVRSADPVAPRAPAEGCHVLPLSAKRPDALRILAQRYLDRLADADLAPADVACTAALGRLHHPHRTAIVFETTEELRGHLRVFLDGGTSPDVAGQDVDARRSQPAPAELEALARAADPLADQHDRVSLRELAALYCAGAELQWARMHRGRDGRRVPLPTYPFEPTRCWVEGSGRPRGLASDLQLVSSHGVDVGIARLSPRRHWELDEHRISGKAVLPGTGLVELVLRTAREAGLELPLAVDGLLFLNPLAVEDDEVREVHVSLRGTDATRAVGIASRLADGTWVEHATATLAPAAVTARSIDADALRAGLHRRLDASPEVDVAKGLVLSERWTGSFVEGRGDEAADELLLEFALPDRFVGEVAYYVSHPSLLDAVINAPSSLHDSERLYLPLSYGRLLVRGSLPGRVVAHVVRRPESVDGSLLALDVTLADEAGHVVMTAENYCLKDATDLALESDSGHGHVQAFKRLPDAPAARPGRGDVLVWGFPEPDARALATRLAALGHEAVHVLPGSDQPEHGRAFAFGLLAAEASDPRTALAAAQAFLRDAADREWVFRDGVLAVTRDALAVTADQPTVRPDQAALLGLLRVAALEFRGLGLRCLDTDGSGGAEALLAEAGDPERRDLVVARDGVRYAPELVRHRINAPVPTPDAAPTAGVVLVSGGTGDLGRAVASHLVERGVARLVLLGSPAGSTPEGFFDDLADRVESLEVHRVDLTDPVAVSALCAGVRDRLGPITGVLHLAGRPGVGFLYDKGPDAFADVFDAKALGAVHLDAATASDDLDFFVVFSSISGLLLNPGQADYTAANMFLDGLAEARRRAGRPWVSLQWPAWRQAGIAQRLDAVDEEELLLPVDTEEALGLLDRVLADTDVPAVLSPARRRASRPAPTPGAPVLRERSVRLFGGRDGDEIEQAVARVWAETLDLAELDAHDEFAALGGNSLLTSHLLKAFEQHFPGQVDITDLFRHTTVASQAEAIRARSGATSDAPAAEPLEDDLDSLLDALEQGRITVEQSTRFL